MKKGFILDRISYQYDGMNQTSNAPALRDVSIHISPGEYVAILGQTGSGKSTLLQHFNGLLKPSYGQILYDGQDIHSGEYSIRQHRMKVAYCFQYPEYQLFEETVLKDICFGLSNMGYNFKEATEKAKKTMDLMGLEEELAERSPFMLSGGQRRKVAIAGLLAMEPEVLLLDEPAAGLDYAAKKNLFDILRKINQEKNTTIILVSHDMDEVAEQADRVIILKEGHCLADGPIRECMGNETIMREAGLALPQAVSFYRELCDIGFEEAASRPLTAKELADYIAGELS